MARKKDRRRALELRKQGMSYNQIKKRLGLSKSTLSVWLREYPLSPEQLRKLRNEDLRIESYRKTMRRKREARLHKYLQEEKQKYLPLSHKELLIAGLFLYWGEGTKVGSSTVMMSNTDPEVLKFTLVWMTQALGIPKEELRASLHLYSDMDVREEITYWASELGLAEKQFSKPYIKKSTREGLTHKGFGHGTCALVVYNVELKERIMMAIKAIAEDAVKVEI